MHAWTVVCDLLHDQLYRGPRDRASRGRMGANLTSIEYAKQVSPGLRHLDTASDSSETSQNAMQVCPLVISNISLGATWGPPILRIDSEVLTVECGDASIELRFTETGLIEAGLSPLPLGRWIGEFESLAAVPQHDDAGDGLRRYRFHGCSLHAALHCIDNAEDTTPGYCSIHSHAEVAELNLFIPKAESQLIYDVYLDNWRRISGPALLWFPARKPHCAVASSGSGLFFVLRLPIR